MQRKFLKNYNVTAHLDESMDGGTSWCLYIHLKKNQDVSIYPSIMHVIRTLVFIVIVIDLLSKPSAK